MYSLISEKRTSFLSESLEIPLSKCCLRLYSSRNSSNVIEKSPIIQDRVFIGFGAKIIGRVEIGMHSYIVAGAIVTKDIPPKSIVSGINNIQFYNKWKGKLKKSQFFSRAIKDETEKSKNFCGLSDKF